MSSFLSSFIWRETSGSFISYVHIVINKPGRFVSFTPVYHVVTMREKESVACFFRKFVGKINLELPPWLHTQYIYHGSRQQRIKSIIKIGLRFLIDTLDGFHTVTLKCYTRAFSQLSYRLALLKIRENSFFGSVCFIKCTLNATNTFLFFKFSKWTKQLFLKTSLESFFCIL